MELIILIIINKQHCFIVLYAEKKTLRICSVHTDILSIEYLHWQVDHQLCIIVTLTNEKNLILISIIFNL